jgi:hypothetical protein
MCIAACAAFLFLEVDGFAIIRVVIDALLHVGASYFLFPPMFLMVTLLLPRLQIIAAN